MALKGKLQQQIAAAKKAQRERYRTPSTEAKLKTSRLRQPLESPTAKASIPIPPPTPQIVRKAPTPTPIRTSRDEYYYEEETFSTARCTVIDIPTIKGEDAPPLCEQKDDWYLIAVADGMGGAGAKKTSLTVGGEAKTEAWVASRVALDLLQDMFHREFNGDVKEFVDAYSEAIINRLKKIENMYKVPSRLKGKKSFPTTIAFALIQENPINESRPNVWCCWSGDSNVVIVAEDDSYFITADHAKQQRATTSPLTRHIHANMFNDAIEVEQCYTYGKGVKAIIVASDGVVNNLQDFDERDQYFINLANGKAENISYGRDDLTVVMWKPK